MTEYTEDVSLSEDDEINIRGYIPETATRVSVNLQWGDSGSNVIAFHTGIRIDEQRIVRNSRSQSGWGREERDLPGGFLIKPGKKFEMNIRVRCEKYEVTINNNTDFSFKHRQGMYFDQVTEVSVSGEISGVEIST